MTTVYAKFIHGGRINTVALVEGLAVEEVTGLLKTVFNIGGTIVGILAEKGLVIPISLVCKSPQVIPNGVCKILVNGVSATAAPANNTANTSAAASNDTAALKSFSSVAANVSTKSVDSEPYSLGVDSVQESEGPVEQVIQEILRFLQSLQQQQVLSHLQFTLLHRLLRSNSTLLFAAYSVAISANDSEYFAEIAKDLANSLLTEQGRSACEAQDEVLQVCDQLYLNERITENQLLYLRHLVLIREEAVARVYDDFQEHQHVPLLAKALFDLANSHPFKREKKNVSQQTQTQTVSQKSLRAQRERQREYERESVPSVDEDRGSEGLDDYDESEAETATQSSAGNASLAVSVARKTRGLTGVASLLSRAGVLSKTETNVLLEMIANENEFVLAAYELYEQNRDLDELQDTLERCVRLEIRKRVTDLQEEELESLQRDRDRQRQRERESELRRAQAEAEADEVLYEDESKSARESDADMRIVDSDASDSDSETESDEDEKNALAMKQQEKEGDEDFGLEDISLDAILQSLDIDENRWRSRVPDLFVQTVFIAVIRAQLEKEQAVALCDLFLGRYDLVLAAWEVFLVQRDRLDLLDTLRRIVRDLDLDSVRPAKSGKSKSTSSTSASGAVSVSSTMSVASPKSLASSSSSSASTSPESTAAVKPSPVRNAASTSASTDSAASASNAAVQAAKNEALQAVRGAKRELLKHSLEMMVKQGLATAENASNLFARYLEGDVLVEAAIESYANDRDVAEFLDTLQILCAHSVEEIDSMMKSAAAAELRKQREQEQGQQQQSQQRQQSSAPMSVSRQELALMQVTDIVKEMLKTDVIGPAVAQAFERLIKARDARLIAAYEQYEQTKNGAALVDSLLRVVIESVEGPQRASASVSAGQEKEKPSPARASPQKSPAAQRAQEREREAEKQRQKEEEEEDDGESATILDKADQKKIIEILYRARAITLEQYDALSQLVDQGSATVTRIFSAYEEDKNVYALMDALKQLDVNPPKAASPAKAPSPQKSSPQKSPVLAQDDDEEDDEEDDADFVEARFMQIVQTMSLSDLETAALRLAIAENDPSIRSAIEQFRNGLDEQRLVQAMREAAQGVIARTLSAKHGIDMQQMMERQMEMENDEDDDEEEEEEEDDVQKEEDKEDGEVSDDEASDGNQEEEEEEEDKNHGDADEDEQAAEERERDSDEENDEQEEHKGDDEDEDNEENEDDDEGNKSDDEGGDEDEENEDDDENFHGNSLITPQRARESVFPILVHELVKENILSQGAGEILLQRFEDGNTVINAALDVYDQDSDMAKLVDTLQTFVEDVTGNDN